MESNAAWTPNPNLNTNSNPFLNWQEMLAALPQQQQQQEGITPAQPRSALMRYQQRRVAHGRQPAVNKGHVKRRSIKRVMCMKCRLLGRKNKRMKRLVNHLHSRLQRLGRQQT